MVGQIAEQQQEAGFLKAVVFLAVLQKIPDGIAAIEQVAFAGNDPSLLVCCISDDVGNPCKTDPDTGSVFVSQTFFYIVFCKKIVGDICIIG